jgi:hypothetical protein
MPFVLHGLGVAVQLPADVRWVERPPADDADAALAVDWVQRDDPARPALALGFVTDDGASCADARLFATAADPSPTSFVDPFVAPRVHGWEYRASTRSTASALGERFLVCLEARGRPLVGVVVYRGSLVDHDANDVDRVLGAVRVAALRGERVGGEPFLAIGNGRLPLPPGWSAGEGGVAAYRNQPRPIELAFEEQRWEVSCADALKDEGGATAVNDLAPSWDARAVARDRRRGAILRSDRTLCVAGPDGVTVARLTWTGRRALGAADRNDLGTMLQDLGDLVAEHDRYRRPRIARATLGLLVLTESAAGRAPEPGCWAGLDLFRGTGPGASPAFDLAGQLGVSSSGRAIIDLRAGAGVSWSGWSRHRFADLALAPAVGVGLSGVTGAGDRPAPLVWIGTRARIAIASEGKLDLVQVWGVASRLDGGPPTFRARLEAAWLFERSAMSLGASAASYGEAIAFAITTSLEL